MRSTEPYTQPLSQQLTNASMSGEQCGIEGPLSAGLDTEAPASTGLRNPNPMSSPSPLIHASLAAASTRLSHQAEIVLALAEVVQAYAAAAPILYAELPYLRCHAPLIPKHAARAIPLLASHGSARDRGRHSVRSS